MCTHLPVGPSDPIAAPIQPDITLRVSDIDRPERGQYVERIQLVWIQDS